MKQPSIPDLSLENGHYDSNFVAPSVYPHLDFSHGRCYLCGCEFMPSGDCENGCKDNHFTLTRYTSSIGKKLKDHLQ